MADIIRIKRRASPGSVGAPSSLANAELAYNENDHTLYIGEGTGGAGGTATVIVPIGGTGYMNNQTVTLSGDVSGSGATAITTTLATVNSNVGTFQGLTVNAKGLVTAASNQNYAPLASPSFSGVPTTPTASPGDSTNQIASTAFVQTAVQNASAGLDAKASVQAAT